MALALDDSLVKGHYLLGYALLDKEEFALAIKEFEKVCLFVPCKLDVSSQQVPCLCVFVWFLVKPLWSNGALSLLNCEAGFSFG